jgi:aminoglycoside phosphotransferase (APT) family kinase protein
MPSTEPRPPAELLAWVQHTLGSSARIVRSTRLTGGLTSRVHRLRVECIGRIEECVLRWWEPEHKWPDWGARAVSSETAVLTRLAASDIPAPLVVASTTERTHGGPALLMTCLPGRLHLAPRSRERWLRQMAAMLARIHALSIEAKPFETWLDRTQLSPPPDASRPEIWRNAIASIAGDRVPTRTCFLHRDYQHFNLLWSRERLTGVVDWGEACSGPAEIDVGHCRLNLTVLFSAAIADRFLAMYEAESGHTVDPWWDVHALLSYGPSWKGFLPIQIDGRVPVDVEGMTDRVEEALRGALRRL